MNTTVYVYLLDEGTDVWRPVAAEHVRDDVYRLVGEPSDGTETWQFETGQNVRCKQRQLSGGTRLVAYECVKG
jgi:hypothetical protein